MKFSNYTTAGEHDGIKIESITVKAIADDSPDTSYIGEYTDTPEEWVICLHCGEYLANIGDEHETQERGREYRFFKPYAGGEPDGSKEYQEYGKQDFTQMQSLSRGDWSFVGIVAKAVVSRSIGNGNRRLQEFSSGGLWGVESNAGAYLEDVKEQELEDLKQHLEAFGVDLSNFDELAADANIEWD